MKLIDLILEQEQIGFTSSEPEVVNKETGTVQWNITATPLKATIQHLDKALFNLDKAVAKNPEDETLLKFRDAFKKLKKVLKSHLTKKYG